MGLYELFDGIILSSEDGVKKPLERIFEIAFTRFGIYKDNSYYVGNDLHDDVFGASRVGLKTVYIETEQSGKYDDPPLPDPDYFASNHYELWQTLTCPASCNK